jgi:hypothetical protein
MAACKFPAEALFLILLRTLRRTVGNGMDRTNRHTWLSSESQFMLCAQESEVERLRNSPPGLTDDQSTGDHSVHPYRVITGDLSMSRTYRDPQDEDAYAHDPILVLLFVSCRPLRRKKRAIGGRMKYFTTAVLVMQSAEHRKMTFLLFISFD